MRPIGFSTGAISRGDFRAALDTLAHTDADAVELSALRAGELPGLIAALPSLDLARFRHVAVHAPSRYEPGEERAIVRLLGEAAGRGFDVVVHPDAMCDVAAWEPLGARLCVENMDKRKPVGRTAEELASYFDRLPEAGLCFDVAHARQVDGSMLEGRRILTRYRDRLRQLHVSEVATDSRHVRVSAGAQGDFRTLAELVPPDVPLIIESVVTPSEVVVELQTIRGLYADALVFA